MLRELADFFIKISMDVPISRVSDIYRVETCLNPLIERPPSYCSIQAIGYDMYLCKDNDEDGVILNGKGERIS